MTYLIVGLLIAVFFGLPFLVAIAAISRGWPYSGRVPTAHGFRRLTPAERACISRRKRRVRKRAPAYTPFDKSERYFPKEDSVRDSSDFD